MTFKWSTHATMKFVEEYGRHPCLWDHDHVDYKNKQARDAALSSLVKTMSIDGFDIQAARKKIRIIRSTYWNELTKISNSKKADSGTDTIYKPKLPWFSVASRFLSKVTNWKDTQPNLVLGNSDHPEINCDVEEKLVEAEPSARSSDIINEGREAILDIGRSSINHQPNHKETNIIITRSHAGHQRYDRKRKICDWQKEDFSMYKAFKALKEASVSNEKDNEFTTFGKSVGQQLQQMPLVDALELQMQIQNMITLRRLKLLRAKAARSPSVQSISCNSGSASIDSSHYDDNDLGEEISVYPDVFNNVDKWKEK